MGFYSKSEIAAVGVKSPLSCRQGAAAVNLQVRPGLFGFARRINYGSTRQKKIHEYVYSAGVVVDAYHRPASCHFGTGCQVSLRRRLRRADYTSAPCGWEQGAHWYGPTARST